MKIAARNKVDAHEAAKAASGRVIQMILSTQADGNGNFRFENVPPGEYYLTSGVFWRVPLGRYSSTQSGGWVSERITVENGKETKQMLTR